MEEMNKMTIECNGLKLKAIVARNLKGGIGNDGNLPWKIPSDLKRFKKLTMGCDLIVGRSTYDSIGKPLPKRRMIILTRDESFKAAGNSVVVHNIPQAIAACTIDSDVWVIGGSEVYKLFLPYCKELHLTVVHSEEELDTLVDLNLEDWSFIKGPKRKRKSAGDDFPTEYQIWRK